MQVEDTIRDGVPRNLPAVAPVVGGLQQPPGRVAEGQIDGVWAMTKMSVRIRGDRTTPAVHLSALLRTCYVMCGQMCCAYVPCMRAMNPYNSAKHIPACSTRATIARRRHRVFHAGSRGVGPSVNMKHGYICGVCFTAGR